jgi:ATP/maltotriose-dependent transcriptional regulator MalT
MRELLSPLVGRDGELEVLARLLDEACAGKSRFVVVRGEPGIGKTCLLAELARRAEQRDCLVLQGRATELERELPFGLVVDAFDAYLESLDPHTYERLVADGLGELGSVFPALRDLGATSADPQTAAERFRAHHAVRELMERLAARQPLVLTLDDLHWSDGASLELVAHLLRRPPDAAILVAASFRTGRAGTALANAIDAAALEGTIEQLVLGPLGSEAVEKLVDRASPADRARLFRESGGNPFYLLELARSSSTRASDGHAVAAGPDGVPAPVTAAIAAELAALDPPARAFAQCAAVSGDPFDLDIAVAATGMPEADALGALDELTARDLLRSGDAPRRFRFRHPMVRSAVYSSCSPGVRIVAHERCARALADWGAEVTARAHHVEHSAHRGDTDAVRVLREAGDAVAERAPSSAARWFAAALRILPATVAGSDRAQLLVALADANAAIGRFEDSHAALLEALALPPDQDPASRVPVISKCAAVEELLGLNRQAHQRLVEALDALPSPDSPDGAALMLDLALASFYRMEYEAMCQRAERALGVARGLGDAALMAAASAMLALGESFRGAISSAMAHC